MTFASKMQHKIYWGPLKKPIEWSLKTILAPWSYAASVLYHDSFWYPTHQDLIRQIMGSDWGRLFHNWDDVALDPDNLRLTGWNDVGAEVGQLSKAGRKAFQQSLKILATCMKEAPEFGAKKRLKKASS
jgi:hypothetical protein